ncbi:MAG TPA: twin-arginine translocation signal domain-containing protein, partial [Candidatus Binatia bacterium]|nr:twin-arginine translocation signal domain-containing protein [Candidatus Binatia bacterium]
MNRRDWIKGLGLGVGAGAVGLMSPSNAFAAEARRGTKSLAPLKITKVRAIKTAPQRARLVVV